MYPSTLPVALILACSCTFGLYPNFQGMLEPSRRNNYTCKLPSESVASPYPACLTAGCVCTAAPSLHPTPHTLNMQPLKFIRTLLRATQSRRSGSLVCRAAPRTPKPGVPPGRGPLESPSPRRGGRAASESARRRRRAAARRGRLGLRMRKPGMSE